MTSSASAALWPSTGSRRAKIVGTLGPSSNTEEAFASLVRAGLDVARLNFSHGSHAQKLELIHMVRKVSADMNKPICILADLQGPKIRTAQLKNHKPVLLETGHTINIVPGDIEGDADTIGTTFLTLAENLEPGTRVLLSDGLIELKVLSVVGDKVECEIINGGMLGERKGINLPGIAVRVPSLTEKDDEDLIFALGAGVDAIAVSFVRTGEDVKQVKARIAELGYESFVIAKLEKPQAIDDLDPILDAADAVMVARGDLGVEMPPEQVPALQKMIIRKCAESRKPVITATQMLESMIDNPRPTRAEASDVANAIYDGTDAVMLSAESAAGKYPKEAVAMMHKIILESERQMAIEPRKARHLTDSKLSVSETVCQSMAYAADELDMKAIAVFTETGTTARLVSKYRPPAPIYALSPNPQIIQRMSMLWGVKPLLCERSQNTDRMVEVAETVLQANGFVSEGDVMGMIAGTRTRSGATNFLRLHYVGDRDVPQAEAAVVEHVQEVEETAGDSTLAETSAHTRG